jgi:Uncharacterized protein involved in exopolysaccharide biosynthesis
MDENQVNDSQEQEIDFAAIINLLIGKWYWYVASVLLFLILGATYIYFTPKEYHRKATILVKDNKKGGASSQMAAFSDMAGLSGLSISNVENEMQILKSRTIMENVITKTGLNISYFVDKMFRSVELYENRPIKVVESVPGTLLPAKFLSYAALRLSLYC